MTPFAKKRWPMKFQCNRVMIGRRLADSDYKKNAWAGIPLAKRMVTSCLTERGFAAGNARQQQPSGIIARKKGVSGALPGV